MKNLVEKLGTMSFVKGYELPDLIPSRNPYIDAIAVSRKHIEELSEGLTQIMVIENCCFFKRSIIASNGREIMFENKYFAVKSYVKPDPCGDKMLCVFVVEVIDNKDGACLKSCAKEELVRKLLRNEHLPNIEFEMTEISVEEALLAKSGKI